MHSEAARGVLAARAGGYFSGSHSCHLFTSAIENQDVALAAFTMMEKLAGDESLASVSSEIAYSECVHAAP